MHLRRRRRCIRKIRMVLKHIQASGCKVEAHGRVGSSWQRRVAGGGRRVAGGGRRRAWASTREALGLGSLHTAYAHPPA